MSGFTDLAWIGLKTRPITDWPGEPTRDRRVSLFSAPFTATAKLLARELDQLGATRIVLGLGLTESQIRNDGLPFANARSDDPRVTLAFSTDDGPLQFHVDAFKTWQDNLRAIALGLEALRKVDRYGITRAGEQYRGWKAIPMSTDPADAIQSRLQAEALLVSYGGENAALKATHPDRGGDPDEYRKVIRAREILSA